MMICCTSALTARRINLYTGSTSSSQKHTSAPIMRSNLDSVFLPQILKFHALGFDTYIVDFRVQLEIGEYGRIHIYARHPCLVFLGTVDRSQTPPTTYLDHPAFLRKTLAFEEVHDQPTRVPKLAAVNERLVFAF